MAWIHVRKWLSFLPAAFVVYVLLHYLLYEPNGRDTRSTFTEYQNTPNSSLAYPQTDNRESSSDGHVFSISYESSSVNSANIVTNGQQSPSSDVIGSIDNKLNEQFVDTHNVVNHRDNQVDTRPELFGSVPDGQWDSQAYSGNANHAVIPKSPISRHIVDFETYPDPPNSLEQYDADNPPETPPVVSNSVPASSNVDIPDSTANELTGPLSGNSLQDSQILGPDAKVSVSVSNMSEEKSVSISMTNEKSQSPKSESIGQVADSPQVSRTLSSSKSEDQIKEEHKEESKPPVKPKKPSVSPPKDTKKTKVIKGVGTPSLAVDSLKGPVTVGDKYEKGFRTPQEGLCPNNGRDLRVLIIVTTAPDHEHHRNAIRQTWGHFSMRKDVSIAFLVGSTARTDIQNLIDRENDRYSDIIEANFVDHYGNLTLKTTAMFEWLSLYCTEAHFVLKTDDDMYINVPLLLAFINTKKNEKRAMFGRLAKGWKPVRNQKSKYYIGSSIYSKARYPDFLTGPAYLFTNDFLDEIYNKALNTTFFMLEDVFMTGFVGESLHIKRVGDAHFRNEKISLKDTCKLMYSISIHMVKYEEQFDIYKRTLDGKTKCKTP